MLTKFIDAERLIHSFKTAIACIIGYGITRLIQLPSDQWVVITIIVVMCAQIYVGSVLQKAYLRFLGTFLGCLFALVAIQTVGTSSLSISIAIGLASFIFSYMATSQEGLSYAGSLGAVTTAIILIGQVPTLTVVVERFIEISIGILIATGVSQFFLPIHARTHLRRSQAATLIEMRDLYTNSILKHQLEGDAKYQDLDETIAKSLIRQRQLAKESASEPLGLRFNTKHFLQTLFCEREILRTISFMQSAHSKIILADKLDKLPAWNTFHQQVVDSFNVIIQRIQAEKPSTEHIHLPKTIIYELKHAFLSLATEERIYLDGYLFAAETLASSLEKLAKLYDMKVYED